MLQPPAGQNFLPAAESTSGGVGDLFREAREESAKIISARLSAAGFDDIPDHGALVLHAPPPLTSHPDRLAATLGITEQQASDTVDELVRRGYLAIGGAAGNGTGRPVVIPTKRGQVAVSTTMTAFKAARWADFEFRPGDIVVSTWPKSGTAWVQTICALLIFGTPDLPAPISELSPWLDHSGIPRAQVYAKLAAQRHRRIIKTHLPLDDIPIDARASYIVVGRHPLDTALSLHHQLISRASSPGEAPPDPAGRPQRPVSSRESLLGWIDSDPSPDGDYHYLAEMMRHMSAAWERRHEPNVTLVHYEDLSADLAGQMRHLAGRLGITVPERAWPGLVHAATFENMRACADQFVTAGIFLKNNATFFRRGRSGEGRGLLTDAELARYRARTAPLAPPDMLAWLHREG